jgi:hypothetical protein
MSIPSIAQMPIFADFIITNIEVDKSVEVVNFQTDWKKLRIAKLKSIIFHASKMISVCNAFVLQK